MKTHTDRLPWHRSGDHALGKDTGPLPICEANGARRHLCRTDTQFAIRAFRRLTAKRVQETFCRQPSQRLASRTKRSIGFFEMDSPLHAIS